MTATHDWQELGNNVSQALKPLRGGAPLAMTAFSGLARAALEPQTLPTKTRELIALAISVAMRCEGCIAFHAEAAVKHSASRDEVMEPMGMAIYMGAGPIVMYTAQTLDAFDQFAAKPLAKTA